MTRKPWRRHLKPSKRLPCSPNKARVKWQPTNQQHDNLTTKSYTQNRRGNGRRMRKEDGREHWRRRKGRRGRLHQHRHNVCVHMCAFLCILRSTWTFVYVCVYARTCTEKDPLEHWQCIPRWGWGERAEHQRFPPCPFTMDTMWLAFLSQQQANYCLISGCNGLFISTQVCHNEQKWAERLWNHYGKRQHGTTVWWMAVVYSRKKGNLMKTIKRSLAPGRQQDWEREEQVEHTGFS